LKQDRNLTGTWILIGGNTGTAGVLCYFGAAFLPVPDILGRLLAFAFGPLLMISFAGIYRYMVRDSGGPMLQIACLFGIIAGVMVTTMLVVQVGNNMVLQNALDELNDDSSEEGIRMVWQAVNRVQYLIDVVWDIFICGAGALLGIVMLRAPRFGLVFGGSGIIASTLLLALNLYTFPEGPAYAGSVDLGPLSLSPSRR